MKLKLFLVLFSIVLIIFLIYIFNIDNKIYYVNITDKNYEYNSLIKKRITNLEKYINIYDENYRITDLIRDINDNQTFSNKHIQNILIKADIITIKMGDNEINYKIKTGEINELFDYCDTLIFDLNSLFELIRSYSKEDIYFIGFYNQSSQYYDEIYDYLNLKIEDMCNKYNINFIKNKNLSIYNNNIEIAKKIIK